MYLADCEVIHEVDNVYHKAFTPQTTHLSATPHSSNVLARLLILPEIMHIQRASLAHLADASALLDEYYEAIGVIERDPPAYLRTLLADPAAAFWIASVESVPAGCILLRPLTAIPAAAECKRLYVRPRFRGQGIADQLLQHMEDHARAAHSSWIYLDSKDDLAAALRLYTQRGYQPCARYNNNPQATIFLRKKLTP